MLRIRVDAPGPLDRKYHPILMFDDASKEHIPAFLDTETGETQVVDPRMKGLRKADGICPDRGAEPLT